MAKAAQRQFLVKVAGIEGYFATKSGGNVTSDNNKVYDGGNLTPDILSAPAQAENVTVGRAFDVERDGPILTILRQQVGRRSFTVSVTPTDRDLNVTGEPVTYPEALLVGITDPDVDAASGDAARFELEFAIPSFV
jgi:hypothetical protein